MSDTSHHHYADKNDTSMDIQLIAADFISMAKAIAAIICAQQNIPQPSTVLPIMTNQKFLHAQLKH